MEPDSVAEETGNCEIMASVDEERLVIADLCRDDAWLEAPVADATPLADWR